MTLTLFLWLVLLHIIVHLILPCLANVSKMFVNVVCCDFGFVLGFTCSPFLCQISFQLFYVLKFGAKTA